jgi:Ca2+-binding RTX toxin-like protein
MIWTDLAPADSLVRVSFSSDGGQNWSTAQTLDAPGEGFTWPPHIAVAPNGDVYADYHADANGEVIVVRSPFDSPGFSGGVFDLSTKFSVFPPGSANLTNNVQGTPPNLNQSQSWTLGSQQAYILPDPTDANRVMIISSDDPTDANNGAGFDDAGVFAVTTTNRGVSWSTPVQVDAGPGTSHQLFPTGAFDLNSQCVSIMYYDSRAGATNASGNFLLDVFVRTSPDSGATWFPEVQINDTPFDPDMLAPDRFPPTQTFRIGEYNGLLHARGAVWTGNNPTQPPGSQNQRIIFDYSDGVAPSFTSVPANVTTSMCGSLDIGTATAEDNECGIGGVVVSNDAPAVFPPGPTVVTWTATDAAGNSVTATQQVTVVLGDNPACCPAGTNVIVGTSNNDTLTGTPGSDCILGLGAQDVINGLGGNDFISGGHGDDVISGGSGNDVIFGGSGQDSLNGNEGNDLVSGDDGDDLVSGGGGNDTLRGGQGQDRLQGGDGNDALFGDDGDDDLQGGAGDDDLVGGVNNDRCDGGTGTNTFAQCELGAPDSCTDGVQNGTETGLDCGGGCTGCPSGGPCVTGADCLGGLCQAGICQAAPPGTLVSTSLSFTTDWGGGYCAVLNVTNAATVLATSYTINLDTNASAIYTSWNGAFSGASGAISVTPAFPWNATLDPGETDSSIGFCANRNVPGSGTLPFVLSTSATF